MEVLISGASGLIGPALRPALVAAGPRPVALGRRPSRGADEITGSGHRPASTGRAIEGMGAAIHLAGVSIADKRWSDEQRRVLRDSRVEHRAAGAAIAEVRQPPPVLVSASAIGWYGDRGDEIPDREEAPGEGFLADLCKTWEAATAPAEQAGTARTSQRHRPDPGRRCARQAAPLFRIGLGGHFGSGRQWQSLDRAGRRDRGDPPPAHDERVGPREPHCAEPGTELRAHQDARASAAQARRAAGAQARSFAAPRRRADREPAVLQPAGAAREAPGVRILVHPSLARGCSAEHARLT